MQILDQPAPIPNNKPPIHNLVIQDIHTILEGKKTDNIIQDFLDRKELGIERYGTPLQSHNGRNALIDAYQELLDAAVYLKQYLEETPSNKGIARQYQEILFHIFRLRAVDLKHEKFSDNNAG